MTVRWTPTALRDLESLHDYLAFDDPDAAAQTAARVVAGIDELQRHPGIGRPGRIRGTRELIVHPYVVAYLIAEDAIEIVAIIHGARRWPGSF